MPYSVETETFVLDQEGQDGRRHRASVEMSGIEVYIAAKLRALAPWSEGSHVYQRVFAEAYQLCRCGSDFNLLYREPEGRYVRIFTQQSPPRRPAWLSAFGFLRGKRRRETVLRRQPPEIVDMRPAGHLWVREKPAWYRVVREGGLNPEQLKTHQRLGRGKRAIWWICSGAGVGLMAWTLNVCL